MTDFLGNEIRLLEKVIYIKNVSTGSSTKRKMYHTGIVTDFTKKMVKMHNGDTVSPVNIISLQKYDLHEQLLEIRAAIESAFRKGKSMTQVYVALLGYMDKMIIES